jgi:hypothetical protein
VLHTKGCALTAAKDNKWGRWAREENLAFIGNMQIDSNLFVPKIGNIVGDLGSSND